MCNASISTLACMSGKGRQITGHIPIYKSGGKFIGAYLHISGQKGHRIIFWIFYFICYSCQTTLIQLTLYLLLLWDTCTCICVHVACNTAWWYSAMLMSLFSLYCNQGLMPTCPWVGHLMTRQNTSKAACMSWGQGSCRIYEHYFYYHIHVQNAILQLDYSLEWFIVHERRAFKPRCEAEWFKAHLERTIQINHDKAIV